MSSRPDRINAPRETLPGRLRIPLGRRYELRLFYRPGRWMTGSECARLVSELRAVTAACLGGRELRYGVLVGSRDRLDGAVVALLRDRKAGRAVGFNAATLLPVHLGDGRAEPVLHSGLCMVVPALQGRGVVRLLVSLPAALAFLRGGLRPLWASNVSQVPAAVGIFGQSVADGYPGVEGSEPPTPQHVGVAEQLMERHRAAFGVGPEADFDARLFVIRNAYTGGSDDLKKSWDEAPLHRDPRWNRLCRERLDYARGDDLLQIGRFTLGHAGRVLLGFLMRSLRPRPRRPTRLLTTTDSASSTPPVEVRA